MTLPNQLLLEHYGGNYSQYIDAVYAVYEKDCLIDKIRFRGEILSLKNNPLFQDRSYTFYHMTHEGPDEDDRTPDLRRCERMPWAKPVIQNCDSWKLKVWPQVRRGKGGTKNRLCIWLQMIDEPDYLVIIDVRKNYKLLWTAFVLSRGSEKQKRQKEYNQWLKTQKSPENPPTTS